ncbi:GDSL-type esterase/lipase family protein [Draconibacterium sp.]|nr:GDSL-type esterase/lipase family protein [Draconibacterium sp.]
MQRSFQLIVMLLFVSLSVDAQVINAGVAGNTTSNLLARIDADVLSNNPDLVIVMVGTNDMLNSGKMNSYEEYFSNLEFIVKKLKDNNANVVLMSPPTVDAQYLFERHNPELFHSTPNVKLDSARQIVAKIARENEVYFIDIFQKFQDLNLPKHNEDLFIMNPKNSGHRDGVHPTRLGYFFIAENVFDFLKKNNLLEKEDKIVCFGDSITKGSKVKGSGTAEGETYPAYLHQFILTHLSNEN